jgi:hypothetical protein
MEIVAAKILAAGLLPPGGNLVVAASGGLLSLRRRRLDVARPRPLAFVDFIHRAAKRRAGETGVDLFAGSHVLGSAYQ